MKSRNLCIVGLLLVAATLGGCDLLCELIPGLAGCSGGGGPGTQPQPGGNVLASSTFDQDNEGWHVAGWGFHSDLPEWSANEGNPGGAISAIFPDGSGERTGYFVAPAEFLGDKSTAYGGAIEFDRNSVSTQVPADSWQCLLIGGDGVQLGFEPVGGLVSGWQHFAIPLDPSGGWKRTDTEQVATEAEIRSVIGNLTGLRIRGAYRDHYRHRALLDNVQIEAPADR